LGGDPGTSGVKREGRALDALIDWGDDLRSAQWGTSSKSAEYSVPRNSLGAGRLEAAPKIDRLTTRALEKEVDKRVLKGEPRPQKGKDRKEVGYEIKVNASSGGGSPNRWLIKAMNGFIRVGGENVPQSGSWIIEAKHLRS